MRRTILFAAVVAVVLAAAAPASAAPKAFHFDISCDMDHDGAVLETSFVITGNHTPGWGEPWSPGDGLSGGVLMGGTLTVTDDDGTVTTATKPPPVGLVPKLTLCRIAGPLEDVPFSVVIFPALVFFPPGPPA
jgi:hypothetical protein